MNLEAKLREKKTEWRIERRRVQAEERQIRQKGNPGRLLELTESTNTHVTKSQEVC
jgi:hypothetical protein